MSSCSSRSSAPPRTNCSPALESAIDGALLVESPEAGRLSFAHALIKQALYEELTAVRRQRMHLEVAQALEQVDRGAERPLASSRTTGKRRARHTLRRRAATRVLAGQRALEQLAPEEAMRWFSKARDLLPGEGPAEQAGRCDVLIGLGEAMRQLGDTAFRDVLLEASEIAMRLDDRERLTRAVLADTLGPENLIGAGARGGTAYGGAPATKPPIGGGSRSSSTRSTSRPAAPPTARG